MTERLESGCRVGVWAGNGAYPGLLAESLLSSGHPVFVAGITGHFDGELPGACEKVVQFGLGSLGKTADFFNENEVAHIFLAGGIDRKKAILTLRPDPHVFSLVPRAVLRGDDDLLTSVAKKMEELGPRVCDPRPYITDSLAAGGRIVGPNVEQSVVRDIRKAFFAAKDLGSKDKGQAAVVYCGEVVGLESKMGTDSLIAAAPKGSVMAKVAKPGQDLRFDIPAIGPLTIDNAGRQGLIAIGVEAGCVLILDQPGVVAACNELGIALFGLKAGNIPDGQ